MPPQLTPLDDTAVATLFTEARTARAWTDEPVTDAQMREIHRLASLPPTAKNTNPMRTIFVQSPGARERLVALVAEGNRIRTLTAPAVALLAVDTDLHEKMDILAPQRPGAREALRAMEGREEFARFNATLQVAYFILAVRAVGLAAGPMTGFDFPAVEAAFLPEPNLSPLAIVNIGHPDDGAWSDSRSPRLPFEVAARII
jgi:3-hydroxypropanoate dehydrogenase